MMVRSFRAGALAPLRNATTPTASRRPPLHRGEFNPLNMEESLCRETILLQGIPDQVRDDGCFLFVGGLFYFRDGMAIRLYPNNLPHPYSHSATATDQKKQNESV